MSAYLDYYLPILTDASMEAEQKLSLFMNSVWVGLNFWRTMGHYVPAKLGLSPVSVMKLFEEKLPPVFFPLGLRGRYLANIETEVRDAYRKDALPDHLKQYLHFDRRGDKEAGAIFKEYYSTSTESEAVCVLEKLALYKKDLLKDIKEAGYDFRLQFTDHPTVGEIIITSQYPQTLMFILLLRKGNLHLTLEVGGDNKIFGLPSDLISEIPHATDFLEADIFGKVLAQIQRRHPEVDSHFKTDNRKITWQMISRPSVAERIESPEISEVEIVDKPPKRKTLGRFIEPLLPNPPSLPKTNEARERRYTVYHTREQIKALLSKNTPAQVVDDAMEAIQQFEYGNKGATALHEDDTFRIKFGKYRIILLRYKGRDFKPVRIGHRKDVYK